MVFRRYPSVVLRTGLIVLSCGFSTVAQAQSQQPRAIPPSDNSQPDPSKIQGPSSSSLPNTPDPAQRLSGLINGTVVDQTGAAVAGAEVKLTREPPSPNRTVSTAEDGQFSLLNIEPGPFQLTISSPGFADQTFSGTLHSGETFAVPRIALIVAAASTEMRVTPATVDVAQDEIKIEEQQRVFGVIPNFYVSYVANAAPLTPKQKFQLAWKTSIDPVSFGVNAIVAGVEQSQDDFGGYGQGAKGYAERYGAAYGNFVIGTYIGSAILPSLLKQDPRFFYKGTGSKRSRVLNALAQSVICKGDNGHWQANYSGLIGGLAASGISNVYYAPKDRDGLGFTFENTLIGIGTTAVTNLLQEFVIRKWTQSRPGRQAPKPNDPVSQIPGASIHAGD
ncbi:MAG TPA: carboxypeptidase-like regulatory domain-containing protein [Methylomirabilota bacterium]|nr:carboxypeptidase-like regulatory domain-containing protein [Methylomirabilota bacterium]